MDCIDMKL